jgi:hypothetical protein
LTRPQLLDDVPEWMIVSADVRLTAEEQDQG